MSAYYTYISKKQIGVIFANWKKGKINLTEETIKFLYNTCAEVKGFQNNTCFEDVLQRVKRGIDCIFSNDFQEAEKSINNAYKQFNCIYH